MRGPLRWLLLLPALLLSTSLAAQSFPNRPLRMVVGFAPGGSTDVIAREYSDELSKALGVPVVVENKTGANGIIGSDFVAKSAPDGHTLLLAIPSNVTNAFLYSKLPFDPRKDFAPVALIGTTSLVLTVHPSLPATNLRELIQLAKAKPGEINSGSAGVGSTPALALELLAQMAGFTTTSVNFRGSAPQMMAMVSGEVPLAFVSIVQVLPFLQDNRLRALAISSTARHPLLPQVPTVDEAGVAGYQSDVWFGVLAPAGTPAPVVAKLNAELTRISMLPDMKRRMAAQGADPAHGTVAEYSKFMTDEFVKWEEVFRKNPMKLE